MELYGLKLPPDIAQLPRHMIELWLFRHAPRMEENRDTPLGKYTGKRYDHLQAAVDLLIPRKEWTWNPWSELMLEAICSNKETLLAGAGSSGKSTAMALYAVIFWLACTKQTLVLCTSTTIDGLKTRVWSEIVKFFNIVKPLVPTATHQRTAVAITEDKDEVKHGIVGRAVANGNPDKSLGNLIGIHPKRMLVIVDEMTDTPQSIIDACWMNFDGAEEEFTFIGSGNPKAKGDPHGRRCEPVGGWSEITVDNTLWKTRFGGTVVHLEG